VSSSSDYFFGVISFIASSLLAAISSCVAIVKGHEINTIGCLLKFQAHDGIDGEMLTCVASHRSDSFAISEESQGEFDIEAFECKNDYAIDLLPRVIAKLLGNIKLLSVVKGSLKALTNDCLESFKNLKVIDFHSNRLSFIEETSFQHQKQLEILDLSHNRLAYLHSKTLLALAALKEIHLTGNSLTYLAESTFLTNPHLELIFLDNNSISFLELFTFNRLKNLKYFSMNNNRLWEVQGNLLAENVQLKALWLSGNQIKRIDINAFESLKNLTVVDLEGNSCIDEAFNNSGMQQMKKHIRKECQNNQKAECVSAQLRSNRDFNNMIGAERKEAMLQLKLIAKLKEQIEMLKSLM